MGGTGGMSGGVDSATGGVVFGSAMVLGGGGVLATLKFFAALKFFAKNKRAATGQNVAVCEVGTKRPVENAEPSCAWVGLSVSKEISYPKLRYYPLYVPNEGAARGSE